MSDRLKATGDLRSPLVEWISKTFTEFESQRRELLEDDWDLAYDAFKGKYSESNLKKWRAMEGSHWRSQVFVRITKMKVMAAVANVNDVMLQGGGSLPFMIKPTPEPRNVDGMSMPPEEARQRAENMNRRLQDTMIQCKYDRSLMTSTLEGAIYGIMVQKAPIVRINKQLSYRYDIPETKMGSMLLPDSIKRKFARHTPYMRDVIMPKVEATNLWDIFWDIEAEDPQHGRAIIHRQKVTPARLREMAQNKPGWDMVAVNDIIRRSETDAATSDESEGPERHALTKRYKTIRILEFWGRAPALTLKDDWYGDPIDDSKEKEIFCIIAGDKIVYKPIDNPLPGMLRPFHFGYWEKMPHESDGVGVPENLRDSQMMINSGVRCFIDNKALSGNVLGAVNTGALEPGTSMSLYPGKIFKFQQGVGRIADAMQWFAPPDVGRGLLELVNIFERFADEESGIPKLLQGENSEHNPETAYATSRLIEAGNRQMGNIIRNIDEGLVEPAIESLYHYFMVNDQDESIKGDMQVQALGFSSYQDRVTRSNNLTEYMMLALSNPILTRLIKPKPFMEEIAKLRDLDEEIFLKTNDELEKEAREMAKMMAKRQEMDGLGSDEGAQLEAAGSLPPGSVEDRPADIVQ